MVRKVTQAADGVPFLTRSSPSNLGRTANRRPLPGVNFSTSRPASRRLGAGPTKMENEPLLLRCAVVGRGRMGTALAARLRDAGVHVCGPLGREDAVDDADVVLLAVPDAEIAHAAAAIAPGPLVGHLSGATTLAPLAPHA